MNPDLVIIILTYTTLMLVLLLLFMGYTAAYWKGYNDGRKHEADTNNGWIDEAVWWRERYRRPIEASTPERLERPED